MAGKEQAHKLSPAPRQLACIHCWCSRRHSHGSYVDVHAFCRRGQQHTEAPDYGCVMVEEVGDLDQQGARFVAGLLHTAATALVPEPSA